MKKGINSTAILAIVLSLPKENPNRNKLIDLMNSALRNKGTLPLGKEEKFIGIIKDLKKEGML